MWLVFYSISLLFAYLFFFFHLFFFSSIHSLHLLFTFTYLLLKESDHSLDFQFAMEKHGMLMSCVSSHSPLLQMNSKSQGEDFLKEGETHTYRRIQMSCGWDIWAHREADNSDRVVQGRAGNPTATQSFFVESHLCLTVGKMVVREATPRISDFPQILTNPRRRTYFGRHCGVS